VRLSAEERAQLDGLIRKGRGSAQLLTKARILLRTSRTIIATILPDAVA
jgi:hypothetical protein